MVTSVPVLLVDAVERLAVEWETDDRVARLWAYTWGSPPVVVSWMTSLTMDIPRASQ